MQGGQVRAERGLLPHQSLLSSRGMLQQLWDAGGALDKALGDGWQSYVWCIQEMVM